MKSKFICVSPKSIEAKVDFETDFMLLHSCKVLNEDDDFYYLENLKKNYIFKVHKRVDSHWEILK